jgi:hypothetical protein
MGYPLLIALFCSVPLAGLAGDGVTDETEAIQRLLDAAAATPSAEVFLPTGRYRIDGSLYIPANTTLRGAYQGPGRRPGAVLLATAGKGREDGPGCIVLRNGSACLRNIAIEYPEQHAEAQEPIPYPYAVTGGHSSRIEEVFLYNAYQGINLDAAHANLVRNIWGEPLRVGVNVDHGYDVSRIENVHFWPYFTLDKPLRAWVQEHGVAFQFGRSDWQYCLNVFSYGYHTGARFYRTGAVEDKGYAGGTTNGNFVGFGADRCMVGVDVEDAFSIGVSFTNSLIAAFGTQDGRAIRLGDGNTGNLTFTNCNFWAVTGEVAEVRAGSLTLSACNIESWALIAKERPCFEAAGGRLNVQGCTFNASGLLAQVTSPEARVTISGNTSPGELRIEHVPGTALVTGLNNPRVKLEPIPGLLEDTMP